MMLKIYCYYNTLGGFFGKPFYDVSDTDAFVAQFTQSMYGASTEVLDSLVEDDLYYLGEFDTVTGVITSSKEFLIHCGEIVGTVKAKKGIVTVPGDTDGKESKEN